MTINVKQFNDISIRGRVAYGICCLENALEHYGIAGEGWNCLLRKMWAYTQWYIDLESSGGRLFLDRWKYISRIQPQMFFWSLAYYKRTAMDSHSSDTLPNKEETKLMLSAYKHTNLVINKISNLIFKMYTSEIRHDVYGKSSATLKLLQSIINVMNKHHIDLPSVEPFEQYAFYKKGWSSHMRGFGEPFNGKQYSKFLKADIIDKYDFIGISIRGRVAYGICCLENALEHYNIQGEGWNLLLKKLWWYMELAADCDPDINNCYPLELWADLIASIQPDSLKAYATYKDLAEGHWCFERNIPAEEEYNLLKEAYKNSNEVINEICKPLHQLGSCELWCGIDEVSESTLGYLQEILDIMYERGIPLPSKEPFEQYVFHKKGWEKKGYDDDLHAFGEMFDGTQYSKFINNAK